MPYKSNNSNFKKIINERHQLIFEVNNCQNVLDVVLKLIAQQKVGQWLEFQTKMVKGLD